ncbi:hypothetical protein [Epilithonimonas sp.]|nr:hypothetical protein [Epilithonimonas sp.]
MNSKVDEHINQSKLWKDEMNALRTIILDCQLEEDFNLVILFKERIL